MMSTKKTIFFFLTILVFIIPASGTPIWVVKTDVTQCSVPSRTFEHVSYLDLPSLFSCLNIEFAEISKTPPILQISTDHIEILLNHNSKLYSVNGQVQDASHPFIYKNKTWWGPLSWIRKFLMADLKFHVYISEETREVIVAQREVLVLAIRTIHQPILTRFVFTPSQVVPFEIQRDEHSITVWLPSKNVQITHFPSQYKDRFVQKVEKVQGVNTTGVRIIYRKSSLHVKSYTLEAPYRFVIDLSEETVTPPQETPYGSDLPLKQFDVIVIDPGHGGKETGTVGPSGIMEKDVTLQVAQKLRDLLISRLGVQVFLTRDRDISLSLEERTALANSYNADLFMSIHANSTLRGKAHGAETYYLSVDWLDEELKEKLEQAEPEAFKSSSQPSGDDVLNMILWDIAQTAYIEESSRIALLIQKTLNKELGISNRGVKQAPFRVLMGARMPAVLIEIGFLNNAQEEKLLSNPVYQQKLALAITKSIEQYMLEVQARYRARQSPALSH